MSGQDAAGRLDRLGFQNVWRNLVVLVVLGGSVTVAYLSLLYFTQDGIIVDLGYKHFASIFGLPAAAAASLAIVLLTRAISGEMSVEFVGFKFKGAAGEAIIWILCFLAITYAIQVTWKLEYTPSHQPTQWRPGEPA